MRKLLLSFLLLVLVASAAFGQTGVTFLPFKSTGYVYKFIKSNDAEKTTLVFKNPSTSETGYATGPAAFGTLNNTSSPPCPLNDTSNVKTFWQASRDLILRKHLALPPGARNLRVTISVDNSMRAFWNGVEISSGYMTHNSCATASDFVLTVPDSLLRTGDNLLAVIGIFNSSKNYLDAKVTGDIVLLINASAGANGTISPSGAIVVAPGANQSFTFTPSTGYHVDSVIVDGVRQATAGSYTFTNVTASHTIRATFAINTYTVTASAGPNGTISPSGAATVNYGATPQYTITPATGYHIDSLLVDEVSVPVAPTYTFAAVTASHTIRAVFAINVYTITASAGAHGSITPSGVVDATYGSAKLFTIQAATDYHVDSLYIDGVGAKVATSASQPVQTTYTFTGITANHTIAATFAPSQYTLSVTVDTDPPTGNSAIGSVTIDPVKALYQPGDSVTLTAWATPGYHLVSWIMPDGARPFINPMKIAMDADKHLTAVFATNVLRTIVVTTIQDTVDPNDGLTSLREALNEANGNPGGDSIKFDIVTGTNPGSKDIVLRSPLPVFTNPIILDFSALTDGNGLPLITIRPGYDTAAYPGSDGIVLGGGFLPWGYIPSGSLIRGLNITGFPGSGICIWTNGNFVQNCVIYSNTQNGVCIHDGNGNSIGNTLAAPSGGRGNILRNNGFDGISASDSNPADAIPPPANNAFLGNSIYDNGAIGIDLGGNGKVTPNKYQGGPSTPLIRPATADAVNFRVNFPTVNIATVAAPGSPSVVQGYLLSWRSTTFRVEIFRDDTGDPTGFGEGKTFLGATTVTTDNDSAYAWFVIPSGIPLAAGDMITATATDQYGNTSEFAESFPAGFETRIYESSQYVINMTLGGIPLHWPDGYASFNLAGSALASGFSAQIESSFTAWNQQALKPTNAPNLFYSRDLPGTTDETWGGYPDAVNNVVWVTSNWTGVTGGAPAAAIAVTRVRYNAINGEMTDVDVAFNAENFTMADATLPGAPTGIKDIGDVAVHEVGHFSGLADVYNPG